MLTETNGVYNQRLGRMERNKTEKENQLAPSMRHRKHGCYRMACLGGIRVGETESGFRKCFDIHVKDFHIRLSPCGERDSYLSRVAMDGSN